MFCLFANLNSESLGYMGYSIRTETYRLTAWLGWDGAKLRADWGNINGTELYNHTGDDGTGLAALDDFENFNIAQGKKTGFSWRKRRLFLHFDTTMIN